MSGLTIGNTPLIQVDSTSYIQKASSTTATVPLTADKPQENKGHVSGGEISVQTSNVDGKIVKVYNQKEEIRAEKDGAPIKIIPSKCWVTDINGEKITNVDEAAKYLGIEKSEKFFGLVTKYYKTETNNISNQSITLKKEYTWKNNEFILVDSEIIQGVSNGKINNVTNSLLNLIFISP